MVLEEPVLLSRPGKPPDQQAKTEREDMSDYYAIQLRQCKQTVDDGIHRVRSVRRNCVCLLTANAGDRSVLALLELASP